MVALYCRTSTDRQEKGLESQRRALVGYCQSKGIDEYLIFADEGISGTKKSRPELNKMMEAISRREINAVFVYSFCRFARSTRHLLETLERFQTIGVSFVSLTENIDTSTPVGRAMFTIISAINQLERELNSERVKNGLMNARKKGIALGRPSTRPDQEIWRLHAEGVPIRKIATLTDTSRATVYRAVPSQVTDDSVVPVERRHLMSRLRHPSV